MKGGFPDPKNLRMCTNQGLKTPRFIYMLIYLLFQEAGVLLSEQSRILSEPDDASYLSYASPCLRCAAPYRATPHPSELRHTLPSYAIPSKLRLILQSYATPLRATQQPKKMQFFRHLLLCT
jgi:hypothetical protein